MGFAGFNCTIPHKVAVISHLDGLGESARIMGAVNCVVRRGSRMEGENTDGRGFLESLRALADPRGLTHLRHFERLLEAVPLEFAGNSKGFACPDQYM